MFSTIKYGEFIVNMVNRFKEGDCVLDVDDTKSLVPLDKFSVFVGGQCVTEVGVKFYTLDLITGRGTCVFLYQLHDTDREWKSRARVNNKDWAQLFAEGDAINYKRIPDTFPYRVDPKSISIASCWLYQWIDETGYFTETPIKPEFIYNGSASEEERFTQLTNLMLSKAFA